MALPQLQNEASAITAYEAIGIQDSLNKIDGGVEVVWETLDRLVEINTASLDTLRNMLEVDLEGIEAARSQAAFDEEAAADAAAQTEITDKETRKSIMQMASDNAGLLLGVTAAVMGLMSMKDWIAEGFEKGLDAFREGMNEVNEGIQNFFRQNLPNADVRGVNTAEQMAREGLGLDTQATIAAEDVAMSQAPIGVTETQMYGMNPQGFLAAQKSREEIANQNAANDPIVMAQRVTEVHSKMREIYKEIQGDIDYAAGKDESNRDVAVAKRNAGIKISEIEKIAQKENVSIPPEIQSFIQSYKTESFQNLQLTTPDQVTPSTDAFTQSITPLLTRQNDVSSDTFLKTYGYSDGNYGIADSPEMKQFEKSQIGVNPAASEPITIYIGGQSKDGASGGGVTVNNNNIDNSTTVVGGSSAAPSVGQSVAPATRVNGSAQDDVRNRSK